MAQLKKLNNLQYINNVIIMNQKTEEKMSEKENPNQGQEPSEDENFMHSINMAFNMGVSANQTYKHTKSVVEIGAELGEQIYQNMSQAYGANVDENFLRANVEYFLQIALMGYIVPTVCAFEPEFKDRLLNLIFTKTKQDQEKRAARGEQEGGGSGGGSRIIT